MLLVPFLTSLDPRAAVKGSRDPLGVQVIWTRLGRNLVTNLTTITESVDEFNTLLLGIHFAEQVESREADTESFLRWEQLAAYSRQSFGEKDSAVVRGVERVKRNLEGASSLDISAEPVDQILSDQKMYGLWGLYISAARASGLIEDNSIRLTETANRYIQDAFRDVLKERQAIMGFVKGPRSKLYLHGQHKSLCGTLGTSLRRTKYPAPLRRTLWPVLVENRHRSCVEQAQLAQLLSNSEVLDSNEFSRDFVLRLQGAAQKAGFDQLERNLERIVGCEGVLAPASAAFSFLLGCNRLRIDDIVGLFEEKWSDGAPIQLDLFASLAEEIGLVVATPEVNSLWQKVAVSLHSRNYAELVTSLVGINRLVMTARGGAPWMEIKSGCLEVNIRGEGAPLPDQKELPELWRFPYFLSSIQRIAWQLRER